MIKSSVDGWDSYFDFLILEPFSHIEKYFHIRKMQFRSKKPVLSSARPAFLSLQAYIKNNK
jgi:hypothetical protein